MNDLFLPIGVIDPGPRDQQPPGGVGGQEHLHGSVAALHQGNGIFWATNEFRAEHDDLTPYGAATGRLQDRSASQGASPSVDAR
jgi:hypothetical protein